MSARDGEDEAFFVDPTQPPRTVEEMFEVLPDRDYGPRWTPLNRLFTIQGVVAV